MSDRIDFPPVRVSALFGGRLARDIADFAPTDVVSLIDPDLAEARRPQFSDYVRIVQRPFFDVDTPAELAANAGTIRSLIAFLSDWTARAASGEAARLLVHCHMGVSRSTAVAYLALAVAAGAGNEGAAFARLLDITSKPWPNRLVISLADAELDRDGRLLAALDAYRAAHPRRYKAYFRLNRRRGLY